MTKQANDNEPTISREDEEAGAYFPDAKDWLDIGRRRLRYQIGKYIDAIYERSGKRFKFTFPLDTEHAFRMLAGLGYQATRKNLDYCIRHEHMKLPPKVEGRLVWDIENVIDFGMQLERMRYWLPHRHDEKKTVWELQAEVEAAGKRWELDEQARKALESLPPSAMLDRIAGTDDAALRSAMGDYFPIGLYERGQAMDEVTMTLLTQMMEEGARAQRKALAAAIRKHLGKKEVE